MSSPEYRYNIKTGNSLKRIETLSNSNKALPLASAIQPFDRALFYIDHVHIPGWTEVNLGDSKSSIAGGPSLSSQNNSMQIHILELNLFIIQSYSINFS
jgi:hypothetical protein